MIRVFTSKTQALGEKGEQSAVDWLRAQGFTIVERNVANARGEIDIVAKKGKETYFFEVKTGKSGALVHPAENLSSAKLRKFLISAEYYAFVHSVREYRVEAIIVTIFPKREAKVERLPLF